MFKRLLYFLFGFTTCGFTLMILDRIGILNPRILNSRRISYSSYTPSYTHYYRRPTTYHVEEVVDINDAVFDTREEAETTLDTLRDLISEYGFCSVKDVKEQLDIKTCAYDENFGWYNLDEARVYAKNCSCYIDFPMPRELMEVIS